MKSQGGVGGCSRLKVVALVYRLINILFFSMYLSIQ